MLDITSRCNRAGAALVFGNGWIKIAKMAVVQ
jgi:hypothetical protein